MGLKSEVLFNFVLLSLGCLTWASYLSLIVKDAVRSLERRSRISKVRYEQDVRSVTSLSYSIQSVIC